MFWLVSIYVLFSSSCFFHFSLPSEEGPCLHKHLHFWRWLPVFKTKLQKKIGKKHSILFWKFIKVVWSNLSLTTVNLRERRKHQKQKTGYTGETGSDQKSWATGAEIKNTLRDSNLRSQCFKLLRKLRQGKACRCFI